MVIEDPELRFINNIRFISSNGDLDLDKGKMVKWIGRNKIDKSVRFVIIIPNVWELVVH